MMVKDDLGLIFCGFLEQLYDFMPEKVGFGDA